MIELDNVTFLYNNSTTPVLSGLTLSIKAGEMVLVHGPSGCGKSTLCMLLNGIIPNLIHGELTGEIRIGGRPIRGKETRQLATEVGMVFQNPDNQLFAITVEEDVAFGPENLGLSRSEIHRRVDEALCSTGLKSVSSRQIHHLSGGQKQRTAIAGLCAMKPGILVLDEPTADLDPGGTRDVIHLLDRLHREEGKTIVIVEHKIREILPFVDRVITLDNGRLASDLPRETTDPTALWPGYPPRSSSRCPLPGVILDLHDIHYRYPDGTFALAGISLAVRRGECIAIIGENGSGKTTLSRIIKGLLEPTKGSVTLYDPVTGFIIPKRSGRIGYLFQNPDHQIVSDRVDREIAIGLEGFLPEDIKRKTCAALTHVDLLKYKDRDPCSLSRGERQRLAVASVLVTEPDVIICDEPTTGQDYDHLLALMEYLETIRCQGKTIMIITHDHELAYHYADRVITLHMGMYIKEEVCMQCS
ncbi:MAG: putative ABC transporter ATP-binding protein [Methanoregula sp. PtaU1.Bin051]|nr:MAG: putative ABC transporter ATP-binding protein [Methanoregula sp. PtaU1.Bin051]